MSKCENCIHNEVCKYEVVHSTKGCEHYKDKSLCVELPCKVGDTVYIVDFSGVTEAFVSNINMFYNYLTEEIENVVDLRIIGNFSRHKNFEDFGKTVFLDRAEAERKLSEVGV